MKALPHPGLLPTGFLIVQNIPKSKQNTHTHNTTHTCIPTHTHAHTVIFSVTIKKKNPSANIKLCKPGPMRI